MTWTPENANTRNWETFPESIRLYYDASTGEHHWGDADISDEGDEVKYVREDTITPRAQIAREFINVVKDEMFEGSRTGGLILKMLKTIKEWEDADEKKDPQSQ